jgi:hypothetical protein
MKQQLETATFINPVVLEGEAKMSAVPRANSLFSNAASEKDQLASKAYRYRRFNMSLMDYRMLLCSVSQGRVDLRRTNWCIARSRGCWAWMVNESPIFTCPD